MQSGTILVSLAECARQEADLYCPVGLQLAHRQLRQIAHYLRRVGIHLPWLGVIHTPARVAYFSGLMIPSRSMMHRHLGMQTCDEPSMS